MNLVAVLEWVTTAAFVALAAWAAYDWFRLRGRARTRLASALACLAAVAVLGRLPALPGPVAPVLALVTVVAFAASAWFVLAFRDAFLPLGTVARRLGLGAFLGLLVTGLVLVLTPVSGPVAGAVTLLFVTGWAALVGEPVYRFWSAARGLPRVQRYRMRLLATGFLILIVVVTAGVLGGSAARSTVATAVLQVAALAMTPLVYVAFAPPRLVRRLLRMQEETELRRAIQDLLIFSPTQLTLAEKALAWAVRLVGGEGGFIAGEGGLVVTTGISEHRVRRILESPSAAAGDRLVDLGGRGRPTAIIVDLPLQDRPARMGVVAGPFTPLFGTEEVLQLEAYAMSVTAGLERVRVTERLAAMERNKTQFLNLASHELRGPLTVIAGYLSMLEAGFLGELNERGRSAVPVLVAKAAEMNSLVEQMIEAARLEDGRMQLRKADAELREVLGAALEVVRPLVDDRHRVVVKTPDRPVQASIDRERVQTIITNLVDNAVKYSPGGGDVGCALEVGDGEARIAVSDSGLGIDPNDMPLLFTRFGRIAGDDTASIPGTGLGLYLARELARLHGGDITVVSERGRGSTFTLHLPVAVPETEANAVAPEVAQEAPRRQAARPSRSAKA